MKKIIEYLIFGLILIILFTIVIITVIYFNYSGDKIQYPTLVYFGTLILLIGIGYGLFNIDLDKPINVSDINDKKTKWINLKVDTNNIDIFSKSYFIEKPKSTNWRIQTIDATFDPENSVVREKIENVYLRYKHYYKGKNREFKSSILSYDEVTLKFLLAEKKEIDLFINQDNLRDYYFDLGLKEK